MTMEELSVIRYFKNIIWVIFLKSILAPTLTDGLCKYLKKLFILHKQLLAYYYDSK